MKEVETLTNRPVSLAQALCRVKPKAVSILTAVVLFGACVLLSSCKKDIPTPIGRGEGDPVVVSLPHPSKLPLPPPPPPSPYAKVDLSNVPRLTPEQIAAIVPQLTPEQVAAIVPQSPYAKVDLSNYATIDLSNFPRLTPEQIAAIVPRLTQEQIDAIMPEHLPYAKVDLSNVAPQPPVDWVVQRWVVQPNEVAAISAYGVGAILEKTIKGKITITGRKPAVNVSPTNGDERGTYINTSRPVGNNLSFEIEQNAMSTSLLATPEGTSGGVIIPVDRALGTTVYEVRCQYTGPTTFIHYTLTGWPKGN
jgi:hypothetical protein